MPDRGRPGEPRAVASFRQAGRLFTGDGFRSGDLAGRRHSISGELRVAPRLRPRVIALVAGALRFEQYSYYMSSIIEHVVLENREMIREDREFTDWNLLAAQLENFVASI